LPDSFLHGFDGWHVHLDLLPVIGRLFMINSKFEAPEIQAASTPDAFGKKFRETKPIASTRAPG